MKVNIGLDLDDNQRGMLADWLDNKTSKRLVTRKDVVGLVDALVMGIVDSRAAGYHLEAKRLKPAGKYIDKYVRDCEECAGLGCDACEDGVVHLPAPRQPTQGWESHPRLTQYAAVIAAGIKAHGYNEDQARSYRRAWASESTGTNR